MRSAVTFLFVAGLLVLASCSATPTTRPAPDQPPVAAGPEPAKVNLKPVVDGNTKFALDLYAELRGQPGNVFLSPYSISSALAMTHAGAKDATAAEMAKVLAFPDDPQPAFRYLRWQLLDGAARGKGYRADVANSLWGQKGYPWKDDFLKVLEENHAAGLEEVDFVTQTEPARKAINAWVEKGTNGRIKDILAPDAVTPLTRLVLVNAIYFKGDWHSQFKKDRTREQDFRLDADKTVKVPMMHQKGGFEYYDNALLQALHLPYAGKDLEMVVLLPKKADGLAEVEKQLTPENLTRWVKLSHPHPVEVALPKFKVEGSFALKDTLAKMGMPSACDPAKANFSGMATKDELFLGQVIHKAFVEVAEEGTEAAAATVVPIPIKGDGPPPLPAEVRFVADHPFLFLIRDTRNDSILFLGRVVRP